MFVHCIVGKVHVLLSEFRYVSGVALRSEAGKSLLE